MKNVVLVILLLIFQPIHIGASPVADKARDYIKNDNLSLAFKTLDNGCKKNDMDSCFMLGYGYKRFDLNIEKAIQYLKKSCLLGHGRGCEAMASVYTKGKAFQKDDSIAKKYFIKAVVNYSIMCDKGHNQHCRGLGWMYLKGNDLIKDPKKAINPYTKACNRGDFSSCTRLGIIYEGSY